MEDLLQKRRALHETSWQPAYKFFPTIIRKFELQRGAEIGVAFGGHAEAILSQTNVVKLYGVDSYRHRLNYDDPMNLDQSGFDTLFERTTQRLVSFGDRFSLIREESKQAAQRIEGTLDFVYIDADHSFLGVWEDLCTWFAKVHVGGVIGGHDYDHPSFPGVRQAIDKFFNRFDWQIHCEGEGVWWVKKQALPVTFFIPAYNCETTLKDSVNSIIQGNLAEGDELILVNDASTDDTARVIADLATTYPGIRVINHRFNKGGGAARNSAIEAANNEILFCLDSDNLLASGSAEKLKDFLITSGADAASFQEVRYFKGHKENATHSWFYPKGPITLTEYLSSHRLPGSSGNYMFTKKSWRTAGRYPEFAGALDTWGFGLRQVATGSGIEVLPDSHYYHRWGHDSYWVKFSADRNPSLTATQLLIPFLDRIGEKDVHYVMSSKGRYLWFDNLENRPLRLKQAPREERSIRSLAHQIVQHYPILKPAVSRVRRLARFAVDGSAKMPTLPQNEAVSLWFKDQGDKTLRLNYELKETSIVFDVGGYQGDWTSDIFSKHSCFLYVFEPVPEFAIKIQKRFAMNSKIRVYPFGFGAERRTDKIVVDRDASSIFKTGSRLEDIEIVRARDFLLEHQIEKIDLMKINIEGGEYELLDHLLDSGLITSITNIQVQFHDFVPNAEERMNRIQERLQNTHSLTYQYPFVWENWRLSTNGTKGLEVQ